MDMELTLGLGNGTNFSHKSNFTNSNIILILPCKVHFAKSENWTTVQGINERETAGCCFVLKWLSVRGY